MVSGQISDAQISASSYADRGWVAENARLLTGRSGWTGQQTKQPFRNEWLQVGWIQNLECFITENSAINKASERLLSARYRPFCSACVPPLRWIWARTRWWAAWWSREGNTATGTSSWRSSSSVTAWTGRTGPSSRRTTPPSPRLVHPTRVCTCSRQYDRTGCDSHPSFTPSSCRGDGQVDEQASTFWTCKIIF